MYQNKDGELDCDDVAAGFLARLISQAEPDSERWSALEDSLGNFRCTLRSGFTRLI